MCCSCDHGGTDYYSDVLQGVLRCLIKMLPAQIKRTRLPEYRKSCVPRCIRTNFVPLTSKCAINGSRCRWRAFSFSWTQFWTQTLRNSPKHSDTRRTRGSQKSLKTLTQ